MGVGGSEGKRGLRVPSYQTASNNQSVCLIHDKSHSQTGLQCLVLQISSFYTISGFGIKRFQALVPSPWPSGWRMGASKGEIRCSLLGCPPCHPHPHAEMGGAADLG